MMMKKGAAFETPCSGSRARVPAHRRARTLIGHRAEPMRRRVHRLASTVRQVLIYVAIRHAFTRRVTYFLQRHLGASQYRDVSHNQIFQRIVATRQWADNISVSGPGSDVDATHGLVKSLSFLIGQMQSRTVGDIPCGDMSWMRFVDLHGASYLGGDIAESIITEVRRLHQSPYRTFARSDLTCGNLPSVDLFVCRDCLVHLSTNDAIAALKNICRSGSRYLLTTTFTDIDSNVDILTGQWRPLNLELPPYNLGPPVLIVPDSCRLGWITWKHKVLGLWDIRDISQHAPWMRPAH